MNRNDRMARLVASEGDHEACQELSATAIDCDLLRSIQNCSENRFTRLVDREGAVRAVLEGTKQFASRNDFQVSVVQVPGDIPILPSNVEFKYSWRTGGSLDDARCWMNEGTDTLVVVVEEAGVVVGYGTAKREAGEGRMKIEIVDVDRYSRRSAGLAEEIALEDSRFQVGVAHLVVLTLLENLDGPLWTDATNAESRYAFKSLGFIHDDSTTNPCILKHERTRHGA